jgi:hypothetical protein
MRSQVQVLAGPPPIVAGQSAAGSERSQLAAGWGRAGAARPSPPAAPVAPPGAAHPGVRLGDDHPPWSRPQPRTGRHAAGAAHLALPPAPVPTAQPPARGAPHAGLAWLVAQGASAAAAARVRPRPPPGQRRRRQRRPRPGLLDRRSSRRRPASHRGVHPLRWSRSPGHLDPGPHRQRLSGKVTDASGRTAGQRTAGRWTGGQQTAERRTLWTMTPGDRTPDGRTAGSRTPNPDGWTPPAGHRRPTPWRACWRCRPRRRRLSSR